MSQDKAQSAVNGYSLNKGCNTVLAHLWALPSGETSSRHPRRCVSCQGHTPFPVRRALLLTAAHLADTHASIRYTTLASGGADLNRPVSPLLHDYKPSAARGPAKSRALQWFAVGLGLPLVGVALITGLSSSDPKPPLPDTPEMTATKSAETSVATDVDPEELILPTPATQEPVITAEPEPRFDTLVLTVGRGDTMERMFRKNELNLGQLMTIARLDEAKQLFRKIKPGDVFEVTHDEGQLISIYSELNLTSALKIEKEVSSFVAKVIERPVETRKRHAYGVINTSLFESATEAGLSDKVIMNVAGIFAWDVDFVLDIRSGDDYYIQYEENLAGR